MADANLSLQARGLFAVITSVPDNVVNLGEIGSWSSDSAAEHNAALQELVIAGYLTEVAS